MKKHFLLSSLLLVTAVNVNAAEAAGAGAGAEAHLKSGRMRIANKTSFPLVYALLQGDGGRIEDNSGTIAQNEELAVNNLMSHYAKWPLDENPGTQSLLVEYPYARPSTSFPDRVRLLLARMSLANFKGKALSEGGLIFVVNKDFSISVQGAAAGDTIPASQTFTELMKREGAGAGAEGIREELARAANIGDENAQGLLNMMRAPTSQEIELNIKWMGTFRQAMTPFAARKSWAELNKKRNEILAAGSGKQEEKA